MERDLDHSEQQGFFHPSPSSPSSSRRESGMQRQLLHSELQWLAWNDPPDTEQQNKLSAFSSLVKYCRNGRLSVLISDVDDSTTTSTVTTTGDNNNNNNNVPSATSVAVAAAARSTADHHPYDQGGPVVGTTTTNIPPLPSTTLASIQHQKDPTLPDLVAWDRNAELPDDSWSLSSDAHEAFTTADIRSTIATSSPPHHHLQAPSPSSLLSGLLSSAQPTLQVDRRILKSQMQLLVNIHQRLHVAIVQHAPLEDIQRILQLDSGAISRPIVLSMERRVYDPIKQRVITKNTKEIYKYPLHLAIHKKASIPVIETLIEADRSVLIIKDGPQLDTPMHVLLKTSPRQLDTLDKMLLMVPFCASIKDRHNNTPLHLAASRGASMDVVQHLCIIYPEALGEHNFHRKLPHELAQQHYVRTSDEICTYLWEQHNALFPPMSNRAGPAEAHYYLDDCHHQA